MGLKTVMVLSPCVVPGYDWTLLDGQYLPYQASRVEVQSWHEFFLQLGVATFLIVRREEVRFKREEIVCTSIKSEIWVVAVSEPKCLRSFMWWMTIDIR